jgi:hypothetical protein
VKKENVPMAATAEDLDVFHRSISNNQTALFLRLRQEQRGWIAEAGAEVCMVEREGSDKIKIRSGGSDSDIWTLDKAIRKRE